MVLRSTGKRSIPYFFCSLFGPAPQLTERLEEPTFFTYGREGERLLLQEIGTFMVLLTMLLQVDADEFDSIYKKEEFGVNCHCLWNLMLLWQPYFYKHSFFI